MQKGHNYFISGFNPSAVIQKFTSDVREKTGHIFTGTLYMVIIDRKSRKEIEHLLELEPKEVDNSKLIGIDGWLPDNNNEYNDYDFVILIPRIYNDEIIKKILGDKLSKVDVLKFDLMFNANSMIDIYLYGHM